MKKTEEDNQSKLITPKLKGWLVLGGLALSLAYLGQLLNENRDDIVKGVLMRYHTLPPLHNSTLQDGEEKFVEYSIEEIKNFAGNIIQTRQIYYPVTLEGLRNTVKHSKGAGRKVQVIGTRHSWNEDLLDQGTERKRFISLIPQHIADSYSLHRPNYFDWITGHTQFSWIHIVGEKNLPDGNKALLVEVGAGTFFLQFARWAMDIGYYMLNVPSVGRMTVAGGVLTHSHGMGLGQPALADNVVALKYVDVNGDVLELNKKDEVDAYISSFGLPGPAISFTFRLEKIGILEKSVYYEQGPEGPAKWFPRYPEKVPADLEKNITESHIQHIFQMRRTGSVHSLLMFMKMTPREPHLDFRNLKDDEKHDLLLVWHGFVQLVLKKLGALIPPLLNPLNAVYMSIAEVLFSIEIPNSTTTENVLQTIHPPSVNPYTHFRVIEYCFPVHKTDAGLDFSLVQRAFWDASDAAVKSDGSWSSMSMDHMDIRFVAPSHLTLSPYPQSPGVAGYGCMCVGHSDWGPDTNRVKMITYLIGKFKSYSHKGKPFLPKPHWAKDTLPGSDAYLRKAYALQIPKVKQGLAKLAAKSRTSVQTLLHVFGNKLQNDLFS